MEQILFNIAKERYEYEIERKERINSALSIPIGIATLLAGGFVTISEISLKYGFLKTNIVYQGSFILFGASLAVTFYFLVRCFFLKYQYLATPIDWENHYNALKSYLTSNGDDQNLEKEFQRDIYTQYRDYALGNYNSNNLKNDFLLKSKFGIIITLFFAFINMGAHYYDRSFDRITEVEKPMKVLILNEEVQMSENQKPTTPPAPSTPQNVPVTPVNQRPQPAPGQIITEGVQPQPAPGKIITGDSKGTNQK